MKIVIQRALSASVSISGQIKAQIGKGLVLLLGIEHTDTTDDLQWLCKKVAQLRIFSDSDGLMNLSVQDIGGAIIVVSQFTLYASCKKGNRPSYIRAARPETAIPLYEQFIAELQQYISSPIQTGEFGADMQVSLINDGPVTIIIDSKLRE
ncbi:MAG: D-tyrosyl-tRNA(Tyr) deacylase [Sphingobacteriales bacterium]|nr:D-tyrosyl-tRNA(Tyr) deacylase [Sphingobacteriales bacterium]